MTWWFVRALIALPLCLCAGSKSEKDEKSDKLGWVREVVLRW